MTTQQQQHLQDHDEYGLFDEYQPVLSTPWRGGPPPTARHATDWYFTERARQGTAPSRPSRPGTTIPRQ